MMQRKSKNTIMAALICAWATLAVGCASGLKASAVDHAVVTRVVVEACKAEGVGAEKCRPEDLEAMARQAECLAAVETGVDCDSLWR